MVDQGAGRGELESSPGARPLSGGRAVSRPTRLHSGVRCLQACERTVVGLVNANEVLFFLSRF